MDTGSELIWTQCEPCTKCMKQLFPIFSPGSSTTYKDVLCDSPGCGSFGHSSFCDKRWEKCVYNVRYGDKSYSSGTVATETFTFAESRSPALHYFKNIQFGCGHDNYFHFASSIPSGIVGLSAGKSSLLTQFGYDRFSYCLTTYEDRKKGSKLHFGEDADVSGRTMVWTPMTEMNVPDLYFVTLEAISVGNKRIEYHNPALLEGGNIVMDSGTVLTVLPVNFYDDVEVAIANQINQRAVRDYKDWRLCYSDPFVMPKITVHLKRADVEWKHENVFIRVSPDYECLAMLPKEGLPIYGNVAQANYLVGYDIRNTRVLFKPTQCGV
ncbi:aspartic proteinase CDR1-like [Salvia hispanica]|uniref:aspartic proteinase CDR1-like n=1 Tax=Salvia hispanica TaxID=49212 RepID=UPI0020091558|nr:aspartic proteinase CDR1-like [Salvia hispanica]